MLKVAIDVEEKLGSRVMRWWDGEGAARVLEHDCDAVLLERASSATSLAELARTGRDNEASRIICNVVTQLHASRKPPPPTVFPLTKWFAAVERGAATFGGIFMRSAATARELLAAQQNVVVLHGDIHHGNILDFGERGWLAIDPKGLLGERGFDYANIFCNPNRDIATAPGRWARRVEVIAEAANLDRSRLLKWILAWSGLSATWSIDDSESPEIALAVAKLSAAALDG